MDLKNTYLLCLHFTFNCCCELSSYFEVADQWKLINRNKACDLLVKNMLTKTDYHATFQIFFLFVVELME